MGGQGETASILAQFGQHALVVRAPVDLELVDQHQVAPALLSWHGGLLGERRLQEAQQHNADQLREVGPDHAAGGTD